MRPLVVLSLVLVAVAAFVIAFFLVGGSGKSGGGAAEPTIDQPAQPVAPRDQPATAQPTEPTRVEAPGDQDVGTEEPDEEPANYANVVWGLVTNDRNEPVAGAKVKLSRDALSGSQMANLWFVGKEPSGAPPHVATTNKEGRYEFKNLPSSRDYFLLVEHPDYAAAEEESIVIARQGESRGPDVVLRAGSRLIGHVYDVANNPVPKARLDLDSAYMMGVEMASPDRLTAVADSSGYFEFNNVAAGPRNLTCSAEGYGVQIDHNVVFKGDAGETLEREFRLSPGHPIGGRVFGPENEPIPGVKLTALNYGSNKSSRGVAVSGDDGAFLIEGLEQGAYILLIEAKGYRQARQNRVQTDDVNVQIEMLRQATLSGRVLGTNGPLDDFTVALNRVTPSPQGKGGVPVYEPTSVKQRFQGARGNFTLEGVDPGTFSLKVSAPGHAPRMSDTFVVVQDQPPQGITVTLSQGGSIRGRIVDPGGRPVSLAQVVSRDDEHGNPQLDEFMDTLITTRTTERKARTNDDGFFELKLLNPGQYRLVIEHPSFTTETVRGVVVAEGQQADAGAIGLRVGGTVRGKVLDRAGKPLPRAWAKLYGDATGTLYQTRTDNEGRFVLEHILPGSYKLSATRSGSTPTDAFGELVDQQNSQVVLQVEDGQVINRDLNLGN